MYSFCLNLIFVHTITEGHIETGFTHSISIARISFSSHCLATGVIALMYSIV
jgi:hypothetical protein